MKRPCFQFRPNMQNEDHRRAWQLLQCAADGQKNALIVRALLQMEREDGLEQMLRRVMREELSAAPLQTARVDETAVPDEMMGFLDALMTED